MTSSQTNTRRSVYKVLLEFTVCRFYSLEQNPRGKVTPMASERSLTHRALIFPTSWRARAQRQMVLIIIIIGGKEEAWRGTL